jgi:pilus assembly protein Flp/PilA
MMLNLFVRLQNLMTRDEGQDMVEYALVVAIIAFGATAAMSNLSSELNTAFKSISTKLSSSL